MPIGPPAGVFQDLAQTSGGTRPALSGRESPRGGTRGEKLCRKSRGKNTHGCRFPCGLPWVRVIPSILSAYQQRNTLTGPLQSDVDGKSLPAIGRGDRRWHFFCLPIGGAFLQAVRVSGLRRGIRDRDRAAEPLRTAVEISTAGSLVAWVTSDRDYSLIGREVPVSGACPTASSAVLRGTPDRRRSHLRPIGDGSCIRPLGI